MSKYSAQFKLEIVQQYLAGGGGYKFLAAKHGVEHRLIGRWVSFYKVHGMSGLEKKFSQHSGESKLSILRYMWDNALSYAQTAALFNIRSQGSIAVWERWYHSGGLETLMPRPRGKPKKMPDSKAPKAPPPLDDASRSREQLLAEVSYLRMENAYLKKLKALVQAQQQQRATARKKRK